MYIHLHTKMYVKEHSIQLQPLYLYSLLQNAKLWQSESSFVLWCSAKSNNQQQSQKVNVTALSSLQSSSIPEGHSIVCKAPNGSKQLVTVGYTHIDKKKKKKNLCKPRTKPRDPSCVCASMQALYTYTHAHTAIMQWFKSNFKCLS